MEFKAVKNKVCVAVLLGLSTQVIAEDTQTMDQIVVWGTSVSSNSENLGDQDISLKQADHMSDLLRDIPGVDVGGTHSLTQRINVRSLGESDLDIRLDGASQHANMFHHIGNLTLNPDILKSVDIEVGNNSVTQSGLGGTVLFETKDGKDLLRNGEQVGARVYGGYASNDNQQGSLTVYGMLSDKVDAMIYGNIVDRNNFEDGDGTETYGSAGKVSNILFKVGYEPSAQHRFELSYDMYRDSGDYNPRPDMSGDANLGLSGDLLIPTDYDRDTITASYQLKGQKHTGKANVYISTTEITRDETVMEGVWPTNRVSVNTAKNQNIGINTLFESNLVVGSFDNQLNYGVDFVHQNSSSTYGDTDYMDENAISSAIFIEDRFYFTDNFSVTAGLRYDNFRRDAETSDKTFDDITWALGIDWDVTESVSLFASARSLFKGPELLETFIQYQDVAYLDDDIKAETGLNSEVGIRYSEFFGEHSVSASATVFQTNIDDYITETYQDDGSYLIENIGDAQIKGFELSTSYGYDAFFTKLSYSRSDSDNTTTGGPLLDANGRSMDIGDSISLSLDYELSSINLLVGWTSNFVLEEDNVEDDSAVKEAYNTHDLYAQWTPSSIEGLQLTFGIDNVTDELYTSHASRTGSARGYTLDDYEPGRNFKLSAAYQF
ncbi:TonB-dependent siderophore receptor [Psychromonas sp. GE-S-Ul-11]|uniref:TonB-dependent siderophore receptor n=1 Tax=Psychromonas sp. GE-S-Ul-11 TaxID=3241170 RepID=UPI00390C4D8C